MDIEVDSGSFMPESLKLRRRMAEAMLKGGMDISPVQSWTQGVARMIQSMMGGYQVGELERKEKEQQGAANAALLGLLGPGAAAAYAPSSAVPESTVAPALAPTADAPVANPAVAGDIAPYAGAIASIESAHVANPYAAVGPATRTGDRAYGKYQVMGNNLPEWTKKHVGREMTAAEFLADPDTQEKVFAAEFGGYLKKYGNPQDAASMWFTGRPAAEGAKRRASTPEGEPLGITGSQYVDRFTSALNSGGPGEASSAPVAVAPSVAPVAGQPQPLAQVAQVAPVAPAASYAAPAQAVPPPNIDAATRQRIAGLLANPATRKLGEAMIAKLIVPKAPPTPLEQAELAQKQAATAKTLSELPTPVAKTAEQFAGGLEQLQRFPEEFGKEAFERAVGPWSATTPQTDDEKGGFWGSGVSLNSLGQNVARGWGELQAAYQGGAAPTEVRDRIQTATKNLAAVMKPMIRKPGEGAWSDKDQANLEAQLGNLERVRDVNEFDRRLSDVKENISKIFLMPVREPQPQPRSLNAPKTAEEEVTPAEKAVTAVDQAIPTDKQILATIASYVTPAAAEDKPLPKLKLLETAAEERRRRLLEVLMNQNSGNIGFMQ